MRALAIIQARVRSTRLPGKVLLPLAGRPALERMIERVCAARSPVHVVVATTVDPSDDPIAALAGRLGVRVFRGDCHDLLDRHYRAASIFGADVVIKIRSDCPAIDPDAIDDVLGAMRDADGSLDYASNLQPATWPDGNDVEAMTMRALDIAWRESVNAFEREHTTPFLWDNPDRFRIGRVAWGTGLDLSQTHRFVLDHVEDYAFLSCVFERLCTAGRPVFSLREALALLERRPELHAINARWLDGTGYRSLGRATLFQSPSTDELVDRQSCRR